MPDGDLGQWGDMSEPLSPVEPPSWLGGDEASPSAPTSAPASAPGEGASSDEALLEAIQGLCEQHPILGELDADAWARVADKGPNVHHIKGQLLEEILGSQVEELKNDAAWLAEMGIDAAPEDLEFIPGHMVADGSNRQITDGFLARAHPEGLEIVAIFESKAGESAARGLKASSSYYDGLSAADKAEFHQAARDMHAEEAAAAGEGYTKTVADVENEIVLTEEGGQVTRDIERLHRSADGQSTELRIQAIDNDADRLRAERFDIEAGDRVPVTVSRVDTAVIGVLPEDVDASRLEAKLQSRVVDDEETGLGYNFHGLNVDIDAADLRRAAEEISTATGEG